MSTRHTDHTTFTIERSFDVPPARVYAAWAEREAKGRWFDLDKHVLDFRVGGTETSSGRVPSGRAFTSEAVYHDIVPEERIVFSYRMTVEGVPISVSLATVELARHGAGTRLTFTEQAVFLDGGDTREAREGGWSWQFDRLGVILAAEAM